MMASAWASSVELDPARVDAILIDIGRETGFRLSFTICLRIAGLSGREPWGSKMDERLVAFFDIGDTLASAVVGGGRIERLEVYPFVPEVLARLRSAGDASSVPVGLISNTGDETAARLNQLLADAGLSTLVDAGLCLFSSVEGLDKSQPAFFRLARDRAGVPASRCLFVGESSEERRVALSVGFLVSPHPLHALHLVEAMLSDRHG